MNENDILFNVITLGDSGVGKTSILKRYAYGSFDEKNLPTIGIGFTFKEVKLKDGTTIKLKLVDTSGQERFNSISKSYFRKAESVLFVFSYDNKNSLEHIEEWFKRFEETGNILDIPLFLLGNKCDIHNKVIDDKLIEDFKNRIGIEDYFKTSAKENIGINDVFSRLAEKIHKSKKGIKRKTHGNKKGRTKKECC